MKRPLISAWTAAPHRRFANLIFVLFALAPLGAGSTSCTSCFAQTNLNSTTLPHHQSVPSFCPRAWIGEQGLHPCDTGATHALQRTLQQLPAGSGKPFVRISLNPLTNDYTFNDAKIALNTNANIIVGASPGDGITTNNWSNAVAQVISHYSNLVWGIDAYNEPEISPAGATNYAIWVNLARGAINGAGYKGQLRICGPATANDYIDGFMSYLPTSALTNLDVIVAHDYFACPGNGQCSNSGTYYHPDQTPAGGYPNLAGRIANLRSWAATAGATNLVILEEYGLYNGDVGDARMTANIVGTNQPCVMILHNPNGPVGNCPWNHATAQGTWDNTLLQFMNAACALPGPLSTNSAPMGDIISSDRLVKWQGNVGVPGGIPNVTTIYSNIAAGASLATVQAALNSCPSNQVVLMAAGSYSWSADLDWKNIGSGVVLRGAGTNTVITFSNGRIYMRNQFSEAALSVDANLSVDAVKGSNTLTLSSVPSWVTVGNLIGLDELDETNLVGDGGTNGGESYRETTGNGARGLAQLNRVMAKTSTTITLETPLYYGFKTSQVAQIFQPAFNPSTDTPRYRCGIEDLKITATYSGDIEFLYMELCDSCWVKNVEVDNQPGKGAIYLWGSYRCEVRHCNVHDSQLQDAGHGYAYSLYNWSCANLIEDNILYHLHVGANVNFGSSGNVMAYNYEFGGFTNGGAQTVSMSAHGVHCYMNLWEGNYSEEKVLGDWVHGSASHNTVFRCRVTGQNGSGDQRCCVSIEYYNRYWNIVGNVLGTTGLQNKYLGDSASTSQGSGGNIFKVGGEVNINNDYSPSDADSYTNGSFILIHGNWDSVQNQVTWNPFVSSHTLTNSYYLSAKPSYFGSLPWPPFNSANPSAASVTNIPAGYRYITGRDPS